MATDLKPKISDLHRLLGATLSAERLVEILSEMEERIERLESMPNAARELMHSTVGVKEWSDHK